MKIISELSSAQIKTNKRDTLATTLSIFLAVVLLGTVIFIISTLKANKYEYITTTVGDYHICLSDVNSAMLSTLYNSKDIEKVSFDKIIQTDLNAVIIEKGAHRLSLKGFKIISGKEANYDFEIIAPSRFLKNNPNLRIGSELKVKGKAYIIVGEYDDYAMSFEESALIGVLDDEGRDNLLKNEDGIEAYVWYKNPRDAYTLTKQYFDEFKIDYSESLDTGRLYFNRDILEYKLIYPSGLIPPPHVIKDIIETYGIVLILVLIFAMMIYGAFNVWNNRDIRELALLKSVGMTERQVKKMIRLKAFKISIIPILTGSVFSYITTNILFYLMWLNNSISYRNISNIYGESLKNPDFNFAPLSLSSIFTIIILAFLTVYLSAIMPALRSAKLNVIEGLGGTVKNKLKSGKSRIPGKIEKTLAADYYKSYNSTYKTIILVLSLSALVMTSVLVSRSYSRVNSVYGIYSNPYNFTSKIYSSSNIDRGLIRELQEVDNWDELHIYESKSFKLYLTDNKDFLSEDLRKVYETGSKAEEDMYVKIIGLSSEDYDEMITENKLNAAAGYVLLNKTPDSIRCPYSFRNYIKISTPVKRDIILRYNATGEKMPIQIDGYIDDFPYDLEEHTENGVYIFTRMDTLNDFIENYGQDEADPVYYYSVQIKAERQLDRISAECEKIIASYIPKSDYYTSDGIVRAAMNNEQLRNENMLNYGIQIILIILAVSNAYNSFHGNLRARKREFMLLSTAGMTEKQLKKMLYGESRILFRNAIIFYLAVFAVAITLRAMRSSYNFAFIVKEILINIDYLPIVIVFSVMALGVFSATKSSIKMILDENFKMTVRDI